MEQFIKLKPKQVIDISKIITILYFKFPKNFVFQGEKHDFWEFIYVDKGEVIITADNAEYCLKAGEMAFHRPAEFHTVRANGVTAPFIFITSFECDSSPMKSFEKKILFLSGAEKELLSKILQEGQACYQKKERVTPCIWHESHQKCPIWR